MNKKEEVGLTKKEVQMERMWKGKGASPGITRGAVTGALIALMLMSAGIARAAFQVRNLAQIDYYSNVVFAYKYTVTDTADIRVLFGPHMYLAKNVKNEITGDSSADMVLCGRGDTVTITLYAANNVSGADTAGWHVYITDTFAVFTQVSGQAATVGPQAADSFVYVTGSETSMTAAGLDGWVAPDSISYYITGSGWSNWQGYTSGTNSPKDETRVWPNGPGGAASISGIRWYWRYVPSQNDPYGALTNLPYNIRVSFKIMKNNN